MKKIILLLLLTAAVLCACTPETELPSGAATQGTGSSSDTQSTDPSSAAQTDPSSAAVSGTTERGSAAKTSSAAPRQTQTTGGNRPSANAPKNGGWHIETGNYGRKTATYTGNEKCISVPDGVETVEDISSSVEELHLPASVSTLYLQGGFSLVEHLRKITVSEDNPNFTAHDGVLYDKNFPKLVHYPYAKPDKRYVLPENVREISNQQMPGGKYTEEIVLHANATIEEYGGIYFLPENLKALTIAEDNPYLCAIDGVPFNKEKTRMLFYPPGKPGKTYTVPSSVTHINNAAFLYVSVRAHGLYPHPQLKTVILPNQIVFIANLNASDVYELENPLEVLQSFHSYLTFETEENSVTHHTLKELGLNIRIRS